jgi:glycosyltransferase involved in cell wall biosynthesis
MNDLSILIPARNEMFLKSTVEDILEHSEGDTDIIIVLDGQWADPPIEDNPRITILYHSKSVGQRAATNEAAKLSNAKFVMKVDAHCAFDQGFDVKMMSNCEHDWTVIPEQRNLHVFDWQCNACGHRKYQGPKPTLCEECNKSEGFEMVIVWEPRPHTRNRHFRFDKNLHFQYWGAYKKRAGNSDMVETMSLIGACWMMHRERYWELDGMDERHGSWGQMGTEIACKSWLSGGKLLCNRTTWFAHLFRTQRGFGFPYPLSGRDVQNARNHSHWLWYEGNWPKAKYPLSWLVEKFAPVPGWEDE